MAKNLFNKKASAADIFAAGIAILVIQLIPVKKKKQVCTTNLTKLLLPYSHFGDHKNENG